MSNFRKYPAFFLFLIFLAGIGVSGHFGLFPAKLFSLGTLQDEGFIYPSGDHHYFYGRKGKCKFPGSYSPPKQLLFQPIHLESRTREIRPPGGYGQFDYARYLHSQNIQSVLSTRGLKLSSIPSSHLSTWQNTIRILLQFCRPIHTGWKNIFKEHLNSETAPHHLAVFSALFLGEKNLMPEQLKSSFRMSGLYHVLAISGFHVALLSGLLLFLLQLLRLPYTVSYFISVSFLWIYVPVCGASESVLRAVIMTTCFLTAKLINRKAVSINSLGIAGCLLLLLHPEQWMSPGFQLSFAASFSILYFSNYCSSLSTQFKTFVTEQTFSLRLKSTKVKPLIHWLTQCTLTPLLVTISAVAGTFPLISENFQLLPLSSLPGTLSTVPLISLAMVAASIGCLSSLALSIVPAAVPLLHALPSYFFSAASLLLDLGIITTESLSKIELLRLDQSHKSLLFWIGYCSFLLLLPWKTRHRNRKLYGLLLCSLILVLPIKTAERLFTGAPEIHFIDVDQGDATLILSSNGQSILVDAANKTPWRDFGESVILPHLRYHGIHSVDMLLLTHDDADHYLGAFSLISQLPINSIGLPDIPEPSTKPSWVKLTQLLEAKQIPIFFFGKGDILSLSRNEKLKFLWPTKAHPVSGSNENSLAFVYQKDSLFQFIATGDLHTQQENAILEQLNSTKKQENTFKYTLLKAGHHGSKTSLGERWIDYWNPDFVYFSAGYKSRFKHPHPDIIKRIDSKGIDYYRSDLDGTALVRISDTLTHTFYRIFRSREDSSVSKRSPARFK